MEKHFKHALIGVAGGTVLALFLQVVHWITGSKAYILLYNMDYIPVMKEIDNSIIGGILFHFVFCIASVVLLYPILRMISLEDHLWSYIFIYTGGSGLLYSLTALTSRPPELGDMTAWFYWTLGHFIYSLVVGWLLIYWKEGHTRQKESDAHEHVSL